MGSILTKQSPHETFELTNLARTVRSKSVTENQDDFEECVLVWLDPTLKHNDDWIEELNLSREIINNLKTFDNPNDCIAFLKMVIKDKIFLIVSQ